MSTYYVYTLSDPRDGAVRYVGRSIRTNNRYKQHTGKPRKEIKHTGHALNVCYPEEWWSMESLNVGRTGEVQ